MSNAQITLTVAPRRVLFLAPLKTPDHPVPSGDRTMARRLFEALAAAGYRPELASRLRLFQAEPGRASFEALSAAAELEAETIIARERRHPPAELVFTYHCYHRAPDLIGPLLADALHMPYVIAEASISPKQAGGPFADGHQASVAAIRKADRVLVLSARDRKILEATIGAEKLVPFPPFLDAAAAPPPLRRARPGPVRLVTVAMMRRGDKLRSYQALAAALALIPDRFWTLDIVGAGEARAEVEALFAELGPRVRFHGECDQTGVRERLAEGDIFLWPGVNEAYGMVYLEAGSLGLPSVAADHGGVRTVVKDGLTGLIVPPDDPEAFAAAVCGLINAPEERTRLAAQAATVTLAEHGFAAATARLRRVLAELPAVPNVLACTP